MWNPTRRNRNIGKTQGGRVKDGRAVEKRSRIFTNSIWRILSEREVTKGFIILRENPSAEYYHPCTPSEIETVIRRFPRRFTESLRAVVLRRLTKLDERRGVEARRRFSCIILNSFPKSNRIYWGTNPPPEAVKAHYAAWCDNWINEDGHWFQSWTAYQANRYYLFHLLLHELGHINQPPFHDRRRRESFAEDFALTWARTWKII
jgi:hypothetical protein